MSPRGWQGLLAVGTERRHQVRQRAPLSRSPLYMSAPVGILRRLRKGVETDRQAGKVWLQPTRAACAGRSLGQDQGRCYIPGTRPSCAKSDIVSKYTAV